jgi:hypothetical protein
MAYRMSTGYGAIRWVCTDDAQNTARHTAQHATRRRRRTVRDFTLGRSQQNALQTSS